MKKDNLKWIFSAVLPLLVMSSYLFFSRSSSYHWTTSSDYFAIGAALIVGFLAIASLSIPLPRKALYLVIYVPVAIVTLGSFSLVFVCVSFGDCL